MRLLSLLAALTLASSAAFAGTTITDFRVQHAQEPLSVEDTHPLFSWKMESDVRGQRQTAYRITLVREVDGSVFWDTGKVESDCSVDIPYRGVALQPEKGYGVRLTVWDKDGRTYDSATRFETGLMSVRRSAWKGAQWIGSKELSLDAASQCLFDLAVRFRIIKGNTASLILGADDFRLGHPFLNGYAVASEENYINVEVEPGIPEIRVYRAGYFPGDTPQRPVIVINSTTYPGTNLPGILSPSGEHSLEIHVEDSQISFTIDGEALTDPDRISINEHGSGGDKVSFPNLCSVGFASSPGSEVEYRDYRILNSGGSEDRLVFGEDRYGIFDSLPGVRTGNGIIHVENPGQKELLGWIDPSHGAETQLRTEFEAKGKIKEARLYVSCMGIYDLYINGAHVGDGWFMPGSSQYRKTIGYNKFDVTDLLQEGGNAFAAYLAEGWYRGYMTFSSSNYNFFGDYSALMARLNIIYEDGTSEDIVTDPDTWKSFKDGPIRLGSFFQGERYDARKETPGWDRPGFDDSNWNGAESIPQREWIDFDITARYDEPVKVREVLTARRICPASAPGVHIYDMGVNMVGVPEVVIPAGWLKEGDVVILRYGEQLYPGLKGDSRDLVRRFGKKGRNIAGHIVFESNRTALDTDFYIASGSSEVTIRPTKTFRGYQYIQVYIPSHEGALPLGNVRGLVLSSSGMPTGKYKATTSDGNRTGELLNRLFANIQRSHLGNFLTIPTDCPQRNERMGWAGDTQVFTRTSTYNSDIQNFFRQWMVSMRAEKSCGNDTEVPGGIGSIIPSLTKYDDPLFLWGTSWSAVVCQVPWQLFCQYGDRQVVEENFDLMMDWLNGMAFYANKDYPYLSTKTNGLADHLGLDERTPRDLLNNAIYIRMMEVVAVMADAIGRTAEAGILRERRAHAIEDWNRAYVDPATGKTRGLSGRTVHTQSSYATPLNFNVFNEENRPKAEAWLSAIVADPRMSGPTPEEREAQKGLEVDETGWASTFVTEDPGYQFGPYSVTTGFSGTPNILPALSRAGNSEDAYRMITNTRYPSWLYPVTLGATSIWECWNSWNIAFEKVDGATFSSFNHFALGSVGEWMYEFQLGITNDHGEGESGYKHFVLQPVSGANYTALEGSYESNYGTISSAWTAEGGKMTSYAATVPANTSATVYLPVGDGVLEAASCEGAVFKGFTTRNGLRVACYEVVSGHWRFSIGTDRVAVE